MTSPVIPTQPVPVHIEEALDVLLAVSADDPNLELALRAMEAAAVLSVAIPLYPPPAEPGDPVPAEVAVEVALSALERAITGAATVEEATRAGAAGAVLRGAPVAWFL